MVRLAFREMVSRRTATAVSATGLLAAIVGFLLLAGTAKTTQAAIAGDIAQTWNTPYDLLVRPPGSKTPLEERDGMIRPNFMAAIDGGINDSQLAEVRAVPGVSVAAPIAVVGYIDWFSYVDLDLAPYLGADRVTALRITTTASGDAGMSHYPSQYGAVLDIVAPRFPVVADPDDPRYVGWQVGKRFVRCPQTTSYRIAYCLGNPMPVDAGIPGTPPGSYVARVYAAQLLGIVGVDPEAERALSGIDQCMQNGRFLSADDGVEHVPVSPDAPDVKVASIPVVLANRSFVDETFSYTIERADNAESLLTGGSVDALGGWSPVDVVTQSASEAFATALQRSSADAFGAFQVGSLWTLGDVRYRVVSGSRLTALARTPDLTPFSSGESSSIESKVPPEARDPWFRSTVARGRVPETGGWTWQRVGTYDPACLPPVDPLIGPALDPFAPAGARLDDGRLLGATRSPGSYVPPPPTILTTLAGARWYADATHYGGGPGERYISVIRVRVSGADAPTPEAQGRLVAIAREIHERTGLVVDIVKGTSAREISVDLPAGTFGRPGLTVTEDWSVKGVAIRFTKALTAQDLGLVALVLVSAALLVAETAFLSVRRRRAEFGVLRALGWPASRIALLVEVEMLLLGLGVGLVASAVGLAFIVVSGLGRAALPLLAAIPLAIVLALLAGVVPALAAARGSTVRAIHGAGRIRPSRVPRSTATLALRDLFRTRRIEAALGVGATGLGAALLGGVLLIAAGFAGRLDTTLLGQYVGARIQPFHLVLAGLSTVIGAMAAGQIVTLGYLERQPELAALRALGWPRRSVLVLLAAQALAIGLLGGLVGAGSTLVLGSALRANPATIALAAAAGCAVAAIATVLAVGGPLAHAYRAGAADALRGE